MKYQLINDTQYSIIDQIFYNREALELKNKLLYPHANQINDWKLLGEKKIDAAIGWIEEAYRQKQSFWVLCDPDVDGYSSAALLINYLEEQFPNIHIDYFVHQGKQHGLCDSWQDAIKYPVLLIPDAGSNDKEYIEELCAAGCKIIILDHHDLELDISAYPENCIVINSQIDPYPNKFLSGVGVVWQFCCAMDDLYGTLYSNNYLDLCAVGQVADMMDCRSPETLYLMREGIKQYNIKNPFLDTIITKNAFSLGADPTMIGIAFYVAPFINAVQRSGTLEERRLVFKSMLNRKGRELVLSTKRGHRLGEMEELATQAVRVAESVKRRQTKAQDEAMKLLERRIEENNMMEDKVLLFLLEPGEIGPGLAGLVANKIMAKYLRPTMILTKNDGIYAGSARGCGTVGVNDFKSICQETGVMNFTAGHPGAFGAGVAIEDLADFIESTNAALQDMPDEPIYYVDSIYKKIAPKEEIYQIAELNKLVGTGFPQPLIVIEDIVITKDNVSVYQKATNTIKIKLSNDLEIIKFRASLDEVSIFDNIKGGLTLSIVAKCDINEYNGQFTPQLILEDYEITNKQRWVF